eukprot:8606340-Lingulodinium_polyedra.AAC.1
MASEWSWIGHALAIQKGTMAIHKAMVGQKMASAWPLHDHSLASQTPFNGHANAIQWTFKSH